MLRKEDTDSAMEMEKGEASGLKKRGVSVEVALKNGLAAGGVDFPS